MKGKLLYILLSVLVCLNTGAQTLSLDSCLSLAVQNNPQLKIALLEVEKAKQVKAQALTKYFPQVKAVGGGFYSLYPMFVYGVDNIKNENNRTAIQNWFDTYGYEAGYKSELELFQKGYGASVMALQPVFAGGQIVNGNRLAKLSIEANRLQSDIRRREVLEQVENTYWLLYSLQLKQRTVEKACQLLDTLGNTLSVATNAGLAIAQDNLKLEMKRNELENKRLQLMIGVDSLQIDTTYNRYLLSDLSDIKHTGEVLQEREESKLLDLQVSAAKISKQMEIGKALPQVAIGAAYSYNNFLEKDSHNGTFFFTVQVPLSQWWETAHKIKEHNINIEQAQLEQQYLNDQLALQDQQLLFAVNESADRLERSASIIANAEENYRLTLLNYNAGLNTMSQLLESQTTLFEAQNEQVDMFINYCMALRRYRK